jgi:hypothetical protein
MCYTNLRENYNMSSSTALLLWNWFPRKTRYVFPQSIQVVDIAIKSEYVLNEIALTNVLEFSEFSYVDTLFWLVCGEK